MILAALHTWEKNSPKDKDLRIALKLLADCLSPEEVETARATVRSMKAKADQPKATPMTNALATITAHPAPSTTSPLPTPRLAAAPMRPEPTPLASAIAAFPPTFGFKHFANTIRFRIVASESKVLPDGRVRLAVHRLDKANPAVSTYFSNVSPDGLRSQIAA
jgi:hypothetical protein